MHLIDTNVVSEARKGWRANTGVRIFFDRSSAEETPLYLSVVTIGELRRGVELIRHRGDTVQADRLESWLSVILTDHADHILPFDIEAAQVWGRLRAPDPKNEIDKQVAAIALIHDLTIVTRNIAHFVACGARLQNPFA
jgi:predicted nucleic acid-binding protein